MGNTSSTYVTTSEIAAFLAITEEALIDFLKKSGLLNAKGKPHRKAVQFDMAVACTSSSGSAFLWNRDSIVEYMASCKAITLHGSQELEGKAKSKAYKPRDHHLLGMVSICHVMTITQDCLSYNSTAKNLVDALTEIFGKPSASRTREVSKLRSAISKLRKLEAQLARPKDELEQHCAHVFKDGCANIRVGLDFLISRFGAAECYPNAAVKAAA